MGIAEGLERIRSEGKVNGNLHGGNLLVEDEKVSTDARIGDVGLHWPCDDEHKRPNQKYGVLPFVAPELLLGANAASDIYSFRIIMIFYLNLIVD